MDTCSPIRLSVIVPVYNASATLRCCIKSILQCDEEDMEVILIDDGSIDNSSDICKEFALQDKRVKVFQKANGGVSSARNQGLDTATGEWVTFVDADDKATSSLLSYIPQDDNDLVCFNWKYTTGETENEQLHSATYSGKAQKEFLNQHLVDYIFRCPWAKLFKRTVIKDHHIRFDERFHLGEDNLFVLNYLRDCQAISTVNDTGYIYLRPSQSKYTLPLNAVAEYLSAFMSSYHALDIDCKPLLLLLEFYYFTKIGSNTLTTRIKWEQCPAIKDIQHICWREYSKKARARIILRKLSTPLIQLIWRIQKSALS